jgi:HIV Tat-specific factor 1
MQWRYKISSEQESSALLSATKLCKLFTSQSEDQPPQLSRSIARVAQGDSEEYKKIEDFPELMQILAQLEDPEYQKQKKEKKKMQKKRKASKAPSNCVYISGLPEDISSDEIFAHFKNIGSIQDDFISGKPRIKIYENQDGNCKGDALLYFEKDLSVASAIHYLNQSQIRPGVKIKVEMAEFDQNENSEDSQGEKKKMRLDKAQLAIKKKLEMKRQKE